MVQLQKHKYYIYMTVLRLKVHVCFYYFSVTLITYSLEVTIENVANL